MQLSPCSRALCKQALAMSSSLSRCGQQIASVVAEGKCASCWQRRSALHPCNGVSWNNTEPPIVALCPSASYSRSSSLPLLFNNFSNSTQTFTLKRNGRHRTPAQQVWAIPTSSTHVGYVSMLTSFQTSHDLFGQDSDGLYRRLEGEQCTPMRHR